MTIKILASLVFGTLCGVFLLPPEYIDTIQVITDGALALLLFSVGFGLGTDGELGQKIKGLPKLTLAIPFMIALGSILGTIVASPFINLRIGDAAMVGAGFGWYSLSAVIISQTYDVTLGALALLSNVFREILAILSVPLIAKKLGYLPAVAPGGATTMDVTLPIISQSTDAQTTLIAFYSGTVLTALVPIVVPLLIQFVQYLN